MSFEIKRNSSPGHCLRLNICFYQNFDIAVATQNLDRTPIHSLQMVLKFCQFIFMIEKENRPTGGVALHSIERYRFLPPNICNH